MSSFQGSEILHNVFVGEVDGRRRLFTRSPYPPHYGERKFGDYREWIPQRSKLGAMLIKGEKVRLERDMKMLYLGCASGTTVSHISDILDEGVIYGVEYSAKPFQKFLELAMERKNIIPILGDAGKPERYSGIVEKVDFIYQDIAQRNQVEIFRRNFQFFAEEDAEGLIFVKARSIDSTRDPEEVYSEVVEELSRSFRVLKRGSLDPYHRDHIFVYVRWKG
ncbi:Fibrillarin-like rRNA methylase [Geoglobus ahangari]|uniref:Fibrillarin-like rRNA/tRNA 2'-O-methyltransferase n=1 Tax=Geoglobus ahangari TaxID=113653 RepID=A0A0F7ICD4_9EURY|nr:fibrillarin-like rRNA/tRNA 2'-O-methyltransferase [Geoglobus ahangari]AKG90914.1 Fibrillarin-like rRNA methylase [Geoglobus ahangari]